jgi:hypothetical protein
LPPGFGFSSNPMNSFRFTLQLLRFLTNGKKQILLALWLLSSQRTGPARRRWTNAQHHPYRVLKKPPLNDFV